MKFRYYAEVPNLKDALELYTDIFEGIIVKKYDPRSYHASFDAFGQHRILLHGKGTSGHKPGYYIFRFDDSELEIFKRVCEKVRNRSDIHVGMDNHNGRWGTTFFEFTDKYGYTWDFEINTSALK